MPTKAPADSAQQKRKSGVIEDITARLKSADASVLTEYRGLSVTDLANLRAAQRPASTDYKVYKNTLARRAAKDAGFDEMAELLDLHEEVADARRQGDCASWPRSPTSEGVDPGEEGEGGLAVITCPAVNRTL